MKDYSIPLVYESTQTEKQIFLRKTYSHVAFALLAFVLVESILLKVVPAEVILSMMGSKMLWLAIIGGFWLLSTVATKFSMSLDRNQQYLGLGLYIFIEAIIFMPMIYIVLYMSNGGENVLLQAATITMFLFAGLTFIAFYSKKDFSFLGSALTIGGFISLGLVLVGAIFGFNLGLWFSVGMCVLAGGSILYQTSKIIYNYNSEQYVGASLELFASIMLLFWYVLRILMNSRK